MKSSIWVMMLSVLFLSACEEETFYPEGLYGYQVEFLLSGESSKIWNLTSLAIDGEGQQLTSCEDSLELHFYSATTGVEVHQLITCTDNSPDTLFSGILMATNSVIGNKNLFTDTLVSTSTEVNNFYVTEITSQRFSFHQRTGIGQLDFAYQIRN